MAERKWTEEQRLAIDTRDRTLLVSAAAGSGKTATLTERIIQSLLDEQTPENINEILIVTFTKAAVAELRERIGAALRDAIRKNPDSERLRRQLALLPSAKIQTIDSFCVDLLRKNCDRVGVSPSFRIPDEAEAKLLALSTMERIIDAVYENLLPEVASAEDFEELADGLTDSRTMSELSETFLLIYSRLINDEAGVGALASLAEEYAIGGGRVENSRPISYALSRLCEAAEHYRTLYRRALCALNPETDKSGKFTEMCEGDLVYLNTLASADRYEAVRTALYGTAQVKKARLSAQTSEPARFAAAVRSELDGELKYFRESFFFLSETELRALYEKLYKRILVLYRFLEMFDREFTEQKRRLGVCQYSDIERYAYECLWDGAPTEIARSEAERYSSVYIDEYQDVNAIQNRIFEAISRADNRFMVGDIKQSIYGFRSARPEIFAEMKRRFPEFSQSERGSAAALFMSKNFRSELPVINFVNGVFDKLFGLAGESIDYKPQDRLTLGRERREDIPCPETHVLPKLSRSRDETEEPSFVAAKIRELIEGGRLSDGRAITPADIAIILRSDKRRAADFAEALERAGVPAAVSGNKNFFLNSEILLALCLLNSVDNPRKDVYLAGLMRSPLFDFSPDELVKIRKRSRCETLYDSLCEYCEQNPEYTKGKEFIQKLKKYRYVSEGLSVDEVVSRLYRETGLPALAAQNGGGDNLMLLYEFARSFEASSFKGLYNFIRYINDIIDRNVRIDDKKEASIGDAVRIITAHGSKGLEFPVVFFVDAGRAIARTSRDRLVYSEGFGISMTVRTDSGLAVLANPINKIISDFVSRKGFEEELRVLYVALTRAKERLYAVGTQTKMDSAKFAEELDFMASTLSPYSVYNIPSFLAAILVSAKDSARTVYHEDVCAPEEVSLEAEPEDFAETEASVISEELIRRFDFEYPDKLLCSLPEKMSVSHLFPSVLDGVDDEYNFSFLNTGSPNGLFFKPKRKVLPAFMSSREDDESAKRGIATHLFMQFCDLERLSLVGAEEELSRLVSEEFISRADAERVRLDEIRLFEKSRLLCEMREAKNLYRELRFNIRLPAAHFTTDEERREAYEDSTVLVQGVIDCIIERADGEILLVDYKTDRLTKSELADRALAAEKLTRSHARQLSYYSMAVKKMFGRKPLLTAVYSLPFGDTIEINVN